MATALVVGLRARGADVQTVVEAGLRGKDDKAQLEWAAANKRTLYTFMCQISVGCIESILSKVRNTLASSWCLANATMLSNKSGRF